MLLQKSACGQSTVAQTFLVCGCFSPSCEQAVTAGRTEPRVGASGQNRIAGQPRSAASAASSGLLHSAFRPALAGSRRSPGGRGAIGIRNLSRRSRDPHSWGLIFSTIHSAFRIPHSAFMGRQGDPPETLAGVRRHPLENDGLGRG